MKFKMYQKIHLGANRPIDGRLTESFGTLKKYNEFHNDSAAFPTRRENHVILYSIERSIKQAMLKTLDAHRVTRWDDPNEGTVYYRQIPRKKLTKSTSS
jgi:hypothetical protein